MYKWLWRVLAVAVIGLLVANIVLKQMGIPEAEQRPVRVPLMAVAVVSVVLCVGRFLIRPPGSPASGRPEADYHDPPA
jgi:hypothetical protein